MKLFLARALMRFVNSHMSAHLTSELLRDRPVPKRQSGDLSPIMGCLLPNYDSKMKI